MSWIPVWSPVSQKFTSSSFLPLPLRISSRGFIIREALETTVRHSNDSNNNRKHQNTFTSARRRVVRETILPIPSIPTPQEIRWIGSFLNSSSIHPFRPEFERTWQTSAVSCLSSAERSIPGGPSNVHPLQPTRPFTSALTSIHSFHFLVMPSLVSSHHSHASDRCIFCVDQAHH